MRRHHDTATAGEQADAADEVRDSRAARPSPLIRVLDRPQHG
jgi:hypothetical protein